MNSPVLFFPVQSRTAREKGVIIFVLETIGGYLTYFDKRILLNSSGRTW